MNGMENFRLEKLERVLTHVRLKEMHGEQVTAALCFVHHRLSKTRGCKIGRQAGRKLGNRSYSVCKFMPCVTNSLQEALEF